jgi:hypothetical protein
MLIVSIYSIKKTGLFQTTLLILILSIRVVNCEFWICEFWINFMKETLNVCYLAFAFFLRQLSQYSFILKERRSLSSLVNRVRFGAAFAGAAVF